jgi:hypothetical protein
MLKHPPNSAQDGSGLLHRDSGHNCEGASSKLSTQRREHNSAVNFAWTILRRGFVNQRHQKPRNLS